MKKIMLVIVSAISIISVAMILNNKLFMNLSAATNGGTVYGRLRSFSMGDSFTSNIPLTDKNTISWQVVAKSNNPKNYAATDWVLASVEPLVENITVLDTSVPGGYVEYKNTNMHKYVQPLNDLLSKSVSDNTIIKKRVFDKLPNGIDQEQATDETKIFSMSSWEWSNIFNQGKEGDVYANFEGFGTSYEYWGGNQDHKDAYLVMSSKGTTTGIYITKAITVDTSNVRPFAVYDMSKFLFSVSEPISSDASTNYKIKVPTLTLGKADAPAMKIRLKNDAYNITNSSGGDVGSFYPGEKVSLKYSGATAGTDKQVSLLLEKDGVFSHYQKVAVNSVSGTAVIDTSGFAVGDYNAFFVTEDITDNGAPIQSSPLSLQSTFEIAAPIGNIKFTQTPQSPNTTSFEHTKNVRVGDKIGYITYENGTADNTYTIVSDSTSTNAYQNFAFMQKADGSYLLNESGRPIIGVINSALNAGTHKFRVKISPNFLDSSDAVYSQDISITVNKTSQPDLAFYSDASFQTKQTQLKKDKNDPDFKIYAKGGSTSISDTQITYSLKSDPNNIISSYSGSGTSADVSLSGQLGTAIFTAKKNGDTNYHEISTDLTITTKENTEIPVITAVKTENNTGYTSGTKYNKDVTVTFAYPSGYNGNLPLKLKERNKDTYNQSWNTITPQTVSDQHQINLTLGANEWIYREYKLYFDGYENNAVTFIVDITNVKPILVGIAEGDVFTEKQHVNLDLYPSRAPTQNPCTATLNGNPYTSNDEIGNGTHKIIVTDSYGNQQELNFTISLQGAEGIFKQTKKLIYDDVSTDKTINNKAAGKVTITSGEPPYTYSPKDAATSSKFRIDTLGNVYIVDGISLSVDTYPVTFVVTDGNTVISDISGEIKVEKGKQSEFRFVDNQAQTLPNTDGIYESLKETYDKDKIIQLNVLGNKGNVTYELKEETVLENGETIDLSDVIEVDATTGELKVKNASLAKQLGKIVVVATSSSTSKYEKEEIELPVDIEKAAQANFAFKFSDKTVQAGKGSFKPDFVNGLSDGKVKLTSTDAMVSVTGVDKDTFSYDIADKKDVVLKAQKAGNRNYEDSPIVSMTLHVMEKGQTLFDVSVEAQDSTINKIYYGDTTATFIPVNPEANATFVYKSLDQTIAQMSGTDTFVPKKAGTVTFEITKSIPGETDTVITKEVIIYPKPITITIDDKEMLKGEAVPLFTFQVPADDLVGMDAITNITMNCKDGSSPVDSTTAKGTYPIKGSYTKSDYPNYDIKIKDGTLTIDQETPLAVWYELLGTKGDNDWYISDVDVMIADAATDKDYTIISGDQNVWADKFTISNQGEVSFHAYFKKDSGAISAGIDGKVKIDKKAPSIKSIQAKNSNNAIEDLINKITFDTFFKKGTQISIQGDDSNGSAKVSGVKEATYTIQKLDEHNDPDGSPKTGTVTADSTGTMKVTMDEVGTYKVCVLLKDKAGNEMEEPQCVQVSIKDPQKDFDSNNDGCPDLNVTLGTGSPVLNIDKNLDGIPELNIDTNGDGKADINIDTDDDGRPDVNLIILNDWKPSLCTTKLEHNYGYQPNIEAKINIAKDNKKAELNIDWDGDMKADFNIDINRDGKADVNIGKIHNWTPEQDYQYQGFDYDTIKKNSIVPTLNIDTNGDGLPDVNLDINGDSIPELNIDNTGDMIPDIDIDSNGDGIKDINIDENGDGKADKNITTITEWKPEKNCDKDGFKYDTMGSLEPDKTPNPDPNPDDSNTPDNPDDSNDPGTGDKSDTLIHDETQIEVTIKGNKHFKSSMKLVVDDITTNIGNEDYEKIMKDTDSSQEVKKVFNARLIEDNIIVQPDGTIEVKIPISDELKNTNNLAILVEKEDGTYEMVKFKKVDGFFVFTTDYLGKISIIGDKETSSTIDNNVTSVQGAYKNNVYGGAGTKTGDETNTGFFWMLIIISSVTLILLIKKKNCKE